MAGVGVLTAHTKAIQVRNKFGRYARECEIAAETTMKEVVEEGAKLSKAMAPRGKKPDPRSRTKLWRSIEPYMMARTSGGWGSDHRAALPQETGARPHIIRGNPDLSFWWNKMGRYFVPASQYYFGFDADNDEWYEIATGETADDPRGGAIITTVNHPGNPPQPFLKPAYEIMMGKIMDIARKNYP